MKWLVVTADDFGLHPGINRGVIQAHRDGILTSASLLVDRPASEAAAALGRTCETLSLGLHLELDPDDHQGVRAALTRQVARFTELVGTPPTHVDSHHDVHRDPRVLPLVRAWTRRAGIPLRDYSAARQVSTFYGQWDGQTHAEQISVAGLLRLLAAEVRDGVTELTCHPGFAEPGLPSSYVAERELELETLCDHRVRRALEQLAIGLIGFRDLPRRARHAARSCART